MSDWIGNIISGVALGVSGLSLLISIRTAQRAIDAEKVTAWVELNATGNNEWLLATLSALRTLLISTSGYRRSEIELPDFRVGDVDEASVDDGHGNCVLPNNVVLKNHYAAMSFDMAVGAGETSKGEFFYQPAHSRRRKAKLNVMYWTLEPKPKWRILTVLVRTRSDL